MRVLWRKLWSHPLPPNNPKVGILDPTSRWKRRVLGKSRASYRFPEVAKWQWTWISLLTRKPWRVRQVAKQRKSDKSLTGERLCEYFLWSTSNTKLMLSWLLPKKPNWKNKWTGKCGFQESTGNICWLFNARSIRLIAVRENSCGSSTAKFIKLIVELDRVLVVS